MPSHKAYACWFVVLGIVAIGLHLVGYVFPAWIVLRSHGEQITIAREQMMLMQKIDEGGLLPPGAMNDGRVRRSDGRMDGPGMHHDSHDHDHDGGRRHPMGPRMHDDDGREPRLPDQPLRQPPPPGMEWPEEPMPPAPVAGRHEQKEMHEMFSFLMSTVEDVEIEDLEVSMHYGLWYSRMCVHKGKAREEMIMEDDVIAEEEATDDVIIDKRDASSSSSSDEGRHGRHHGGKHGKKCHCKRLSTKCALKMAFLFESPMVKPSHRLGYKNMAGASLCEHRVEASIGLALLVLGLILGILAFRKPDGCRCVKLVTIICMLVALVLIIVPVIRVGQYNYYRYNVHDGVQSHLPYSAIFSSSACSLALFCAIVTFIGMIDQGRREKPGRWYQFNNELNVDDESKQEKGEKSPALVFYSDAYPTKAGLVDVCDFSTLKPQEEMEPEKKPLE